MLISAGKFPAACCASFLLLAVDTPSACCGVVHRNFTKASLYIFIQRHEALAKVTIQ